MSTKHPTILLVDDDPATNFLNHRLLQHMHVGGEVLMARNGLEALTLLMAHWHEKATISPALILLDMEMPVMTGPEFLGLYSRLPEAERDAIVVVTLTNSIIDQDAARAHGWPVTDFLTKPLTRESVLGVLQRHFGYVPAA